MAEKVFVGLSGGVDSAVSAARLQRMGYDVVGAFIKIWRPEFTECTWREDRLDAMRVCAALSIPYREIDLSEEYKQGVVDRMVADYRAGITPNPDVLCNREIKFGRFADWAFEQRADKVATGHYARIGTQNGAATLLRAVDAGKDQSYFLHRLTAQDLSRALFPLGESEKSEVRAEATKLNLPVAQKPDSQGLCFVGQVSIAEFLSRYIPLSKGRVLDARGKEIGEHDGAALYTIGQRHGLTHSKNEPLYITAIDIEKNILHVSPRRDDAAVCEVQLLNMHWISGTPELPLRAQAQARYHETRIGVTLVQRGDAITATFDEAHIAAPGQSLVIYDGDRCLGGGIISA